MESLLLFRRALTSPTMCRFIPALSVRETNFHSKLALSFVIPSEAEGICGFLSVSRRRAS